MGELPGFYDLGVKMKALSVEIHKLPASSVQIEDFTRSNRGGILRIIEEIAARFPVKS